MNDGPRPQRPLSDAIDNLTRMDLRWVALGAFAIGVALHACVAVAVLGGDASSPAASQPDAAPIIRQATPVPTRPADRTNCAEIRGTDYRSDAERDWFRLNCSLSAAPADRPLEGRDASNLRA